MDERRLALIGAGCATRGTDLSLRPALRMDVIAEKLGEFALTNFEVSKCHIKRTATHFATNQVQLVDSQVYSTADSWIDGRRGRLTHGQDAKRMDMDRWTNVNNLAAAYRWARADGRENKDSLLVNYTGIPELPESIAVSAVSRVMGVIRYTESGKAILHGTRFRKSLCKVCHRCRYTSLYGIRHGIFRLVLPDFIKGLVIGPVIFSGSRTWPITLQFQSVGRSLWLLIEPS
ncbi:hypothetical protein PR048_008257 [Dryococelus australis]|uniref:Uncharacterized protein n=1 Tax=Dryococelus australis TaxID=614101 RepID=A0ABQ9HWL0_9NEOP|nr:hypothetical protein PR048_008257 [Dryococelus australis]